MNAMSDYHSKRAQLTRMVAFLLSLANMAVRTSQFSLADRRTMFAILRPVELRICAFVTGRKDDWDFMVWAPGSAPVWARHDDSPEDALRLAAAFRTMAFALAYILTRYRRFWNRSTASPNADIRSPDRSARCTDLPPHRRTLAIDSSGCAPCRNVSSRGPPAAVSHALS